MSLSLKHRPGVCRPLFLSILFFIGFIGRSVAQAPDLTVRADLPAGLRMQQITFGNGIYLACSNYPVVLYRSTDGSVWSRVTTGPDLGPVNVVTAAQHPALAYGAGCFVLVSDSGRLFSSPDGVSWTPFNTGILHKFQSVQFLNNSFYAVGDSATLFTSPDGLSWTAEHIGLGSSFDSYQGISYGNGLLVLESWFTDPPDNIFYETVYRSSGGVGGPWTADTLSFLTAGNLRFLKDHFYKLGPKIQASTDALNWTNVVYLGVDTISGTDGFTDGSSVYLNVGTNVDSPGTLLASADGLNFTSVIRTPLNVEHGAYFDRHYFVYGLGGVNASSDGVHYHVLGSARAGVAGNGVNYVKVSTNSEASVFYSSTDFSHWTTQDSVGPGVSQVIYDGTQYITGLDTVYTSVDGVSWSKKGLPNVPLSNLTYGGGVYVISGVDPNTGVAELFYSSDAMNWTASTLPDLTVPRNPPLSIGTITKIRYLNGHFFALTADGSGSVGSVLSSVDGTAFSFALGQSSRSSFPYAYDDVVYVSDSLKYYFMGTVAPDVYHSDLRHFFSMPVVNPFDSLAPIDPSLSTISGPAASTQVGDGPGGFNFAYSHGHFIGSVDDMGFTLGADNPLNSYLLWSSDGLKWDSYSIQGYTEITSTVASVDTFRMEGINNYEIVANFAGSGGALPVGLFDFSAVVQDNVRVELSWKTAFEQNSRGFAVQRRIAMNAPAATGFTDIGFVAAAGNSNQVLSYRFTDGAPASGFNDYRLLMTDLDGATRVSEVKRVWIGDVGKIVVYPNPVRDYLTIQAFGTGVVTLYDATGREVGKQDLNGASVMLPMKDCSAGVYYLFVRLKDGSVYRQTILHE
jgi:hypothetical protein